MGVQLSSNVGLFLFFTSCSSNVFYFHPLFLSTASDTNKGISLKVCVLYRLCQKAVCTGNAGFPRSSQAKHSSSKCSAVILPVMHWRCSSNASSNVTFRNTFILTDGDIRKTWYYTSWAFLAKTRAYALISHFLSPCPGAF